MPSLSWLIGLRAERHAARHLRRNGYTIVEKNIRLGRDELDLVAYRNGVVVFVEVRFRSRGTSAAALSVCGKKSKRLKRAVAHYRSRENLWSVPTRIDVIAVTRLEGEWCVSHIEDAY